jgi:hypothetical protein
LLVCVPFRTLPYPVSFIAYTYRPVSNIWSHTATAEPPPQPSTDAHGVFALATTRCGLLPLTCECACVRALCALCVCVGLRAWQRLFVRVHRVHACGFALCVCARACVSVCGPMCECVCVSPCVRVH